MKSDEHMQYGRDVLRGVIGLRGAAAKGLMDMHDNQPGLYHIVQAALFATIDQCFLDGMSVEECVKLVEQTAREGLCGREEAMKSTEYVQYGIKVIHGLMDLQGVACRGLLQIYQRTPDEVALFQEALFLVIDECYNKGMTAEQAVADIEQLAANGQRVLADALKDVDFTH